MIRIAGIIGKTILWTIVAVLFLAANVVLAVYNPLFQMVAVKYVPEALSASGERQISVADLRLRFPLNLEVQGLSVVEHGDTTVGATSARVKVALAPLLGMRVEVDHADIEDGLFTLGTPDSLLYLRVRRASLSVDDARVSLLSSRVDVDVARLSRGSVDLVMLPDSIERPDTATAPAQWVINARLIEIADLDYRMAMMPIIDTLRAHVGSARLVEGMVDMTTCRVHARSLDVDSVTASYLFPTPGAIADFNRRHAAAVALMAQPKPPTDSPPWTITADAISLTAPKATYAMAHARPEPGLDMNYIEVNDIAIKVDSFYNRMMAVRVPLRELRGVERCGLRVAATGTFEMDSVAMRLKGMKVSTPSSYINADGYMGVGDLMTDQRLPLGLKCDASIYLGDVKKVMPALGPLLNGLPQSENIAVTADLRGTPSQLDVTKLSALLPRHAYVNVSGTVRNPMRPESISGTLNLEGKITDVAFAKTRFLDPATAKMVNIPPFTINGSVNYAPGEVSGDVTLASGAGDLALKAGWVSRTEGYDVDLDVRDFPVNAFLPTIGVGHLTARLKASGHGFDPFRSTTDINLTADVDAVSYLGERYSGISATAHLNDGRGAVDIVSNNPGANLSFSGEGNLQGRFLDWTFDTDVRELDLQRLRLSPTPLGGTLAASGRVRVSHDYRDITANLNIEEVNWRIDTLDIAGSDIMASVISNDTLVDADIDNRDLHLCFNAPLALPDLMRRFTMTGDTLLHAVHAKKVDVGALSRAMPTFNLDMSAGTDNILAHYMSASADVVWQNVDIKASKDSLINLAAKVVGLEVGNTVLDTITADVNQNGGYLLYNIAMHNRPGNLDDWASVDASGYLADDNVGVLLQQRNVNRETGFLIGGNVTVNDSTVNFSITPYQPTIAYKKWQVNPENYISYNYIDRNLKADLSMSNQISSLRIYTEQLPGSHDTDGVVVHASDIKISDWISFNPFAPPVDGMVSADMRFNWDKVSLNGKGTVGVHNLTYGKERVGDFDLDANVSTTPGGPTRADIGLMVDGVKTITASGVLNDSTLHNPFLLDFSMIRFPLEVVNPFLPMGVAKVSGVLNGEMAITGEMSSPTFNGYINFDSAAVNVTMLGTSFGFSPVRVPVKDNVVSFNDFAIKGVNDNPLNINGTVDMGDITNPKLDLTLNANNMQVVGTDRRRGKAEIFGKGYIGVDAKVKGDMRVLNVDAALDVLSGTNVTYVLQDAQSVIASQSTQDMVKFVNFSDSTAVAEADSLKLEGMVMNLDAMLNVRSGTTVNVYLSSDGKNKVTIQGQGTLNYTQNYMNDGRLTGRFTINSGFARYTLPPLSEKRFDITAGSYVAFNGNMLNPVINLHAVDEVKANVTQEGQNSRLVNFDVGLSVTNSLQNMNIAFDLSTDDDITVQNELQSMSPEQRANQAMNILLYGMYQGAGTKGDANIGGNVLYSFLESQLNSLASRAIKGVDLAFGINQYDNVVNGTSSTATSYSYQVSKSLFNDRVKIVVGGHYSTDANTEENFAENLFNDISFEYLINKSGSMYVKVFRHVGYESILEGEVTQTGVGFVYKRKIRRLIDMFKPFRRRRNKQAVQLPQDGAPLAPSEASPTPVTTKTEAADEKK